MIPADLLAESMTSTRPCSYRSVEARGRYNPSLTGAAGLRAVDEDTKDPGLEGRAARERPDPLDHAEPGVLLDLVASAQRADHGPIVGRHDLRGA